MFQSAGCVVLWMLWSARSSISNCCSTVELWNATPLCHPGQGIKCVACMDCMCSVALAIHLEYIMDGKHMLATRRKWENILAVHTNAARQNFVQHACQFRLEIDDALIVAVSQPQSSGVCWNHLYLQTLAWRQENCMTIHTCLPQPRTRGML